MLLQSPNGLRLLCFGGSGVLSILTKVIPVSPTDKWSSSCPCLRCAVLGQLPSFRGQAPDFEAQLRDPEPPKAAAALTGECARPTTLGWKLLWGLLRQCFGFNSSFPLSTGEFVNHKLFLPEVVGKESRRAVPVCGCVHPELRAIGLKQAAVFSTGAADQLKRNPMTKL